MKYIDFLFEMAAPTPMSMTNQVFYHGTTSATAAKAILKNGIQPPVLPSKKNMLTPVDGMVYLTPAIGYALIYAVGGNYVGNESLRKPNKELFDRLLKDRDGKTQRYGYIFEVSGAALNAIQPDEDSIGELYSWCMTNGPSKYNGPEDHAIWSRFSESVNRVSFVSLVDSVSTELQKKKIADGEYTYMAAVGKKAAKKMPNWMKIWLCEIGLHMAHLGPVIPSACWQVDKTKIGWIHKNGDNFQEFSKKLR